MNKIWNKRKYYNRNGVYFRIQNPQIQLAHDIWNFYNPNDKIEKNDGNVIHHINKNSLDNRIENLQKMTHGEHSSLHRQIDMIGNSNASGKRSNKTKIKISNALKGNTNNKGKNWKISNEALKRRPKKRGHYKKKL